VTDRDFMEVAIEISAEADYPYGAVIVKGGKIVGRSDAVYKEVMPELYTHSEYRAVQDAIRQGYGGVREGGLYGGLEGCTVYTSCQPCMICVGVLLYKGVERIVYAATLSDSSDYVVQEIETDTEELIKMSHCGVRVEKELMRSEAVEVLKNWGKK